MAKRDNQITRLIPPETLQRILDTFAAATGYAAHIADRDGRVIVASGDEAAVRARGRALTDAMGKSWGMEPPKVSIMVGAKRLATLALRKPVAIDAAGEGTAGHGAAVGVEEAEAAQLLYLLAETLAQACRQGLAQQSRLEELTTLFQLSKLLSARRNLSDVLNTVTRSLVEVLGVKAAAIRLLDENERELRVAAACNLSEDYLNKGTIHLDESLVDQMCLTGDLVYIKDMATSDLVLFRDDARREGLASVLAAGMIYRDKPVGVLRVFTGKVSRFTDTQKSLLRAIAQLAAGSIRHAQLDAERLAHVRIRRQVDLAADVQRRLMPQSDPKVPPFDVAGRYEPCFELGGDFYDLIEFEQSLGVVVGDVVGKGVAASLLMASVRASLRAHVEDVYDLDEVMSRVNTALVRDTRDNEFATVFYGTLDRQTRRLTYCSAGHDPALLLRGEEFIELSTGGMVLGVDPTQTYDKGLIDLEPGDILLLYTDGVTDATHFSGEKFGKARLMDAVREARNGSARDIVNHVLWQVRRYVGLNHRPDDMTIVAAKVGEQL